MTAEIITIGDEILLGQTVDTNSAWIGEAMAGISIPVTRITSISDKKEVILATLAEAVNRSKVILITGGLGPTKDDLTKHTLAEFFGSKLVRNEQVLHRIETFFARFNRPMLESNRMQADLPDNCIVLDNLKGTASGMWFNNNGVVVVSMPGVPYEMQHIMQTGVLPRLAEQFNRPDLVYKSVLTQGLGESFLAEIIADWELELEKENIALAYLPSPGFVKLRLTGLGYDREEIEKKIDLKIEALKVLIPDYYLGSGSVKVEEVVGELLKVKNLSLSTAESCTGGTIAKLITSVPGSSTYFYGSVVAYSEEVKTKQLSVKPEILEQYGVVSEQVAEEMAKGALALFGTDFALATTGIAGPDGGSESTPVGTVCIALASVNECVTKTFSFGNDRLRVIDRASIAALGLLIRAIKAN
ncbi:MAG: competence/damage-inducible protein A [Luteibaculaceae bacterium]